MSKLNIDQKSIKGLFSDKKADFLIPDYLRPSARRSLHRYGKLAIPRLQRTEADGI